MADFFRLGKRWIEKKFSESLEKFKHEQAKEIETLRQQINSLFSRISKIHEREFIVLPKAWKKLHIAYGAISKAASMLKEVPNASAMEPDQLEAFLTGCRLPPHSQNRLR